MKKISQKVFINQRVERSPGKIGNESFDLKLFTI